MTVVRNFQEEFSEEAYTEMVGLLNGLLGNLGLDNFDGQVKEVTLPGNSITEIRHDLKVVPRYRIMLRQTNNVELSDGPVWNENKISIQNNSVESTDIKILILK